ncbi:HAD-like domain-containing protein [Phascolomyces articulosus]|uniref:HAD-like domain-containing protein n=1 Tax=Phascolomyces articulosus TaxID=60185 RepID=A0AAD5JZV6_9FUNG|nr:HAD-like domain-containing protein [Phascolomyces articulosus]
MLDKYGGGVEHTWDFKSKLMGCTRQESSAMIVNHYHLPLTVQEYMDECALLHKKIFPFVKPLPGVERLIHHLHANDIPMAVATSSTRSVYELKTSLNKDLFSLFDLHVVCSDDPGIEHGKPSPDLFLAAQQRLGNPPSENCLVFEDAINGIQAAQNAKMHAVWIPDNNLLKILDSSPDSYGASVVLDSMTAFDPKVFSLPEFDNDDKTQQE